MRGGGRTALELHVPTRTYRSGCSRCSYWIRFDDNTKVIVGTMDSSHGTGDSRIFVSVRSATSPIGGVALWSIDGGLLKATSVAYTAFSCPGGFCRGGGGS